MRRRGGTSGPPRAERGLALERGPAIEWLRERGSTVAGRGVDTVRLFGDRIETAGFEVYRVWRTQVEQERLRVADVESGYLFVMIVEGTAALDLAVDAGRAGPGSAMLVHGDHVLSLHGGTPLAMIAVRSELPRLGLHRIPVRDRPLAFRLPDAYGAMLASLVTAMFEHQVEPVDHGFSSVRLSVEALVAAGLATALRRHTLDASATESAAYERGLRLIETRAGDPGFSAAMLAELMGASRRQIERAFAAFDDSPYAAIRRHRAGIAAMLISASGAPDGRERARIAELAGFRTSRAMNEAISDFPPRARHPPGRPGPPPGAHPDDTSTLRR